MEQTLYKLAQTGKMQVWRIHGNPMTGLILIEWGQLGGTLQMQSEVVKTNASNRNIREQVQLRVTSRVNKQKDKGYCETLEQAEQREGLNAVGLVRPMLAQVFEDVKAVVDPSTCYVQYKYNGHRCLITKQDKEVVAYSRNGKLINSIPHILNSVGPRLEEGMTLDGELYIHGESIQQHGSLIKRLQPGSERLKFVCYDVVSSAKYAERLDKIVGVLAGLVHTKVAPTRFPQAFNLATTLTEALEAGYEGLILRQPHYGYQVGGRSRALLKVKACLDEEFKVLDVEPSADRWGVLVCETAEGKQFRTSAPGTMQDKKAVLDNKHLYIGQMVQVEFFEWTESRVPFHPRAIRWRNKTEE